jgi:hypothetical protein
MTHTNMAMIKLQTAVVNKLAASGLTVESPWNEIADCLAPVCSPTSCIEAAKAMRQNNEHPPQ